MGEILFAAAWLTLGIMNNIDEKIAQSESQWREYRYKNMGIRESAGRLCNAFTRSAKKRINCAIRNALSGVKATKFQLSYDEKKENIVISLTSTKGRIKNIFPTLNSLVSQTVRPDIIILWLGRNIRYPRSAISKIKSMGVVVKYRKDLGPNTKYYYAFSEYKKNVIITIDDDIIYHKDMIKELYETYLNHKGCVIARRVHKIRFGSDRQPVRYRDWIWEYRSTGCMGDDLFATGCGGVLYPPTVISLKCWENTDFLEVCPTGDDIWLKFCELYCGIKVYPVKNAGFNKDVANLGIKNSGLAAVNVDDGMNDKYMKSCTEYFGFNDNLCERVLGEGLKNGIKNA